GEARYGVFVGGGGVLDIHGLTSALGAAARERGAEVRPATGVRAVRVLDGRIAGVELDSGERILTGAVVLAAGAWTARLGEACAASGRARGRARRSASAWSAAILALRACTGSPASAAAAWRSHRRRASYSRL